MSKVMTRSKMPDVPWLLLDLDHYGLEGSIKNSYFTHYFLITLQISLNKIFRHLHLLSLFFSDQWQP